jgi:hypothetical protein
MKKILKLCLVFLLFYVPLKTKAQCDSLVITDIPCDSVIAAINGLSQYTISGTDTPYSVPFAVAYLEICYPEYNADSIDLAALLHCCHPAGINYNDSTLSYCETAIYFRLLLQYALPHRSCLPSWTYNYLIAMLLPQIPVLAADSNISLLCKDVNTCNVNCVSVCDDTIISSCDSINSVNFVYTHILADEGLNIDTNLLVNVYTTLFRFSPPYNTIISQINNCNPNDTLLTKIIFSARNMQLTDSGQYFEFDVMATDTPNNILFAESNIYIAFDTTTFGSNLVSSGAVTASKGMAIDSPYYNVSVSDSLPNMLKLSVTHTINPTSLTNLDSVNQQLCHLRVRLSSYISGGVAFDSSLMSGQSFYQRTPGGLATPYDLVLVSGLEAPLSTSDPILFSIANAVIDSSKTHLDFDVTGYANDVGPLDDYTLALTYNALAFDSAGFANTLGYGDDGMGDSVYDFNTSFGGGVINISLFSNSYYEPLTDSIDDVIYDTVPLVHVTLRIADCSQIPAVSIDPTNSGGTWNDPNNQYDPNQYGPVEAGDGYNNDGYVVCVPLPNVIAWYPTCTNAGSFQVVTIYGEHFGTDVGTVYFTNATTPSGYVHTLPQDIRLWTDDTIKLLIPSDPQGVGVAGSGNFYVQTAINNDNRSDNLQMPIGYANYNLRNDANPLSPDYMKSEFVFLRDTPYVFQVDSFFFYTPGAMTTIADAMSAIYCATGLSLQLDYSGPALIDSPVEGDGINLISLQHYTSSIFPTRETLAYTNTRSVQSCYHGLPEYNNMADYILDIDISVIDTPSSGTWYWPTSFTSTLPNFVYFEAVIIHELGHAVMLMHTQPQDGHNVMFPGIPQGDNIYDIRDTECTESGVHPGRCRGLCRSYSLTRFRLLYSPLLCGAHSGGEWHPAGGG